MTRTPETSGSSYALQVEPKEMLPRPCSRPTRTVESRFLKSRACPNPCIILQETFLTGVEAWKRNAQLCRKGDADGRVEILGQARCAPHCLILVRFVLSTSNEVKNQPMEFTRRR